MRIRLDPLPEAEGRPQARCPLQRGLDEEILSRGRDNPTEIDGKMRMEPEPREQGSPDTRRTEARRIITRMGVAGEIINRNQSINNQSD